MPLEAGEEQASPHQPCVEMMTYTQQKAWIPTRVYGGSRRRRISKFPLIWRTRAFEEERRLAYVGITRAKQNSPLLWKSSSYTKKNVIYLHVLLQNCHQNAFKTASGTKSSIKPLKVEV